MLNRSVVAIIVIGLSTSFLYSMDNSSKISTNLYTDSPLSRDNPSPTATDFYAHSRPSKNEPSLANQYSRKNGKKPSTPPFKCPSLPPHPIKSSEDHQNCCLTQHKSDHLLRESTICSEAPHQPSAPTPQENLELTILNTTNAPITLQAEYSQPRQRPGMPPFSPYIIKKVHERFLGTKNSIATISLARTLYHQYLKNLVRVILLHPNPEVCPLTISNYECTHATAITIRLNPDNIYEIL